MALGRRRRLGGPSRRGRLLGYGGYGPYRIAVPGGDAHRRRQREKEQRSRGYQQRFGKDSFQYDSLNASRSGLPLVQCQWPLT